MKPRYLRVKNLEKYQHYGTRRNPPWIKLYREFLSDYQLRQCPVPSRLFFGCCFILASETENCIPYDLHYLSDRVGFAVSEETLTPLIHSGLLLASKASSVLASDEKCSNLISSSLPNSSPKREESEKGGKKGNGRAAAFPESWQVEGWMEELCAGHRLNTHKTFAEFKNYHLAHGSVMKSWPHAFRNWVSNAVKFALKGSRP